MRVILHISFLIALTILFGCQREDTLGGDISPQYTSNGIEWYNLPYDVPEIKCFGGKCSFNVERYLSTQGLICPYSLVLGDSDADQSPMSRVFIFFHAGHGFVKYSHLSPGINETVLFKTSENAHWLKIECKKNPGLRWDASEDIHVIEISESEFLDHAWTKVSGVRYVGIKNNRVVIGGIGKVKGYVLRECSKGPWLRRL